MLQFISDIKKGDTILTVNKQLTKVICVIEFKVFNPKIVRINNLGITPWHPIQRLDSIKWAFPATIGKSHRENTNVVYNLVLDSGHIIIVDNYECVTFGHNLESEVVKHDFFGDKIIDELNDLNVNVKLITDGDVLGALYVSDPKYNVDMFMGTGGGPEGVLAASALDSYDCHFQGRFIFDNEKDIQQANSMGIKDLDKKYELNEIVKGDSIFCATGITDSSFIKGITFDQDKYISETLITHKNTNYKQLVKNVNSINE